MLPPKSFLFVLFPLFLLWLYPSSIKAQKTLRIQRVFDSQADSRTLPANSLIADKFPYRAIVKVIATFPDGSAYGSSGVLVSADVVFTSAHSVYAKDLGGKAIKVEIIPAYNGGNKPFGSTFSSKIQIPDEYIKSKEISYDFAAIRTNSRIGDFSGWLGYGSPTTNFDEVLIIGYPNDDKYDGRTMIQSTSSAFLSNKNELHYKANTSQGMSGSPIIIKIGNDFRVIGVHSTGGDPEEGENFNFGVRFIDDFLRNL